jgi:hypothetical protein
MEPKRLEWGLTKENRSLGGNDENTENQLNYQLSPDSKSGKMSVDQLSRAWSAAALRMPEWQTLLHRSEQRPD